jgi:hypothetical protein
MLLLSNVLFAIAKPFDLIYMSQEAASVTEYIYYYVPISLDWISTIVLMVTLNEIAAI